MPAPPKPWRGDQAAARERYLRLFGPAQAPAWVSTLTPADEAAYLADLAEAFAFQPGMAVLDAGAGAGAFTRILARLEGLHLTALEPSAAMLATFDGQAQLQGVARVEGFCDHAADEGLFPAGSFDAIASRQLLNGLFDPFVAFQNWHRWLKPGGALVLVDGLYGREAWAGDWAPEVDELPLAANQSLALVPYLLEHAGFQVQAVRRMAATNALPGTRSERYLLVATKALQAPS